MNIYIFLFHYSWTHAPYIFHKIFFSPQFCDEPINKEGSVRGQGLDFLEFDIPTKVPNGYLFCSQNFQPKSKHLLQSLTWKRGRYVERGYKAYWPSQSCFSDSGLILIFVAHHKFGYIYFE